MVTPGKETLLTELDRLLDVGEPLLAAFPKYYLYRNQYCNDWRLQLPNTISDDMRWYADHFAWRASNRKRCQNHLRNQPTAYLTGVARILKAGLLGWRAVGIL